MSIEPPSTSVQDATPKPYPSALALPILLLGGFITVFDLFVVNIAIPSMQADLGASFADIGFVIAGYELAFGVLLIAGGRLGDRHGRRRLFALGMAGFTITSFLCGIAPNAPTLIGARLFQGAAGAILFPQVYALLRVMYDDAGRRRAFGLLGMTLGLAAIAGQVLGGLIVESDMFGLGWRSSSSSICRSASSPCSRRGSSPNSDPPMRWASTGPASDWRQRGCCCCCCRCSKARISAGRSGHGSAWRRPSWC
jgi:MFS family permease